MGSVRSICTGRIKVTVTRKRNLAPVVGKEDVGGGRPSLARRRLMIVFLWVSFIGHERTHPKTAKKIKVHCVHCQPSRTETKDPMTGLCI